MNLSNMIIAVTLLASLPPQQENLRQEPLPKGDELKTIEI